MAVICGSISGVHPEAIKGYLECRKVLVERETTLSVMRASGPSTVLIGYPDADERRKQSLVPVEEELAIVRKEIAEIDELVNVRKPQ